MRGLIKVESGLRFTRDLLSSMYFGFLQHLAQENDNSTFIEFDYTREEANEGEILVAGAKLLSDEVLWTLQLLRKNLDMEKIIKNHNPLIKIDSSTEAFTVTKDAKINLIKINTITSFLHWLVAKGTRRELMIIPKPYLLCAQTPLLLDHIHGVSVSGMEEQRYMLRDSSRDQELMKDILIAHVFRKLRYLDYSVRPDHFWKSFEDFDLHDTLEVTKNDRGSETVGVTYQKESRELNQIPEKLMLTDLFVDN